MRRALAAAATVSLLLLGSCSEDDVPGAADAPSPEAIVEPTDEGTLLEGDPGSAGTAEPEGLDDELGDATGSPGTEGTGATDAEAGGGVSTPASVEELAAEFQQQFPELTAGVSQEQLQQQVRTLCSSIEAGDVTEALRQAAADYDVSALDPATLDQLTRFFSGTTCPQ